MLLAYLSKAASKIRNSRKRKKKSTKMEQTAIELTAAVRARDPEQVDTSIAKLLSLTTTPPTLPPPADTPFDDDTEDTKWCAVADSIQPAM